MFAQVVVPAFAVFLASVALVVVLAASDDRFMAEGLVGALCVALFVGAVRLGTLLGCGLSPTRRGNRWAQTGLGAAAGLMALNAVGLVWLAWSDQGWIYTLQGLWPVLIPAAFGLAAGFARIDRSAPPSVSGVALFPVRLVWGIAVLFAAGAVLPIVIGLAPTNLNRVQASAAPLALPSSETITALPFVRPVEVQGPPSSALVAEVEDGPHDTMLHLYNDQNLLIGTADEPECIVVPPTAGRYRLEVRRFGDYAPVTADLADLLPFWGNQFRRRPGANSEAPASADVLDPPAILWFRGLEAEQATMDAGLISSQPLPLTFDVAPRWRHSGSTLPQS